MRFPLHDTIYFLVGFLALSLFLHVQVVSADDIRPYEIAEKLQQQYEKATSISAHFTQETSLQLGHGRKRQGKGSVVIQKPGLMRWDYTEPDPQTIVCDGKTISIYLEKAKQLMIGDARDYLQSDVTYTFFTGTGDILRDFDILPPDDGKVRTDGGLRIKLIPKNPHPHVDMVVVLVDPATYLVRRLEITDRFGSVTTMTFDHLQLDVPHPDSFFVLHPPPDTEIIRQ